MASGKKKNTKKRKKNNIPKKNNKPKNNSIQSKKKNSEIIKKDNVASDNKKEPKKIKKEKKKKVIKVEDLKVKKDINLPKLKENKKNGKSNAKRIATRKKKRNSYLKKVNKLFRKIRIYGIQSVFPLKNVLAIMIGFFALIILVFFVRVIINKASYIDLALLPDKIDQLQTLSFSIDDGDDIINSSGVFTGLTTYYEYDFEKVFKLDKSYVSEHFIKFNKMNGNTLVIIKPTEGNADKVREIFDAFFKSMNDTQYEYLEYQGYQIFINSSNNPVVISKIKQSQTRVFNILQEIRKSEIEKTLDIKDSWYKEALVKTSMLRTDTCEYIIFKPRNKSSKSKIMNAMNKHYADLEEKWKDKDNENYNLVLNRKFVEYHGYLIYVVSHDNELALELIKG